MYELEDKEILKEAGKITNPIEWSRLFKLADKAKSPVLKTILKNKGKSLYHRE